MSKSTHTHIRTYTHTNKYFEETRNYILNNQEEMFNVINRQQCNETLAKLMLLKFDEELNIKFTIS